MNYLYNGVKLPAVPETELPYMAIRWTSLSTRYELFLFQECEHGASSSGVWCVGNLSTAATAYYAKTDSEAWVAFDNTAKSISVDSVKWANFDVLNEDGSVFLKASEPVPVDPVTARNPAAMAMGFQLGTAIRRMRGTKQPEQPPEEEKTPIAYLYNGVQAPDVCTVGTDGHPYGLIYQKASTGAYYLLKCMDAAYPAQGFLTYSEGQLVSTSGVGIYGTRNILSGGAWVYEQTVMGKTLSLDGITLIWTNTDIPNADGSTYLAATEPVPVYE